MLESATLITFAVMLLTAVVYDLPLLAALILGWVLFFDYGLLRGHDMASLTRMSLKGLRETIPVLVLFALIGALTASWRAAGTIPAITCWSVKTMTPGTLVIASFVLCSVMSMLTGSSFAAAATTGVICMTVATSMGANEMLVGGAIISGSFLGDHCSPMSSSASLVAGITETSLFDNVGRMLRTGTLPFVLCLMLYGVLGSLSTVDAEASQMTLSGAMQAFRSFELGPVVLLPVALVFLLCLFRVNVKATMVASLICATLICVRVQGLPLSDVLRAMILGFQAPDPAISRLVDGGGVMSMAEISAIVAVASTYSGLFEGTGLIDDMGKAVQTLSRRTTPYVGVLATSVMTAVVACDQVVSIMLVRQLCDRCEEAGSALALDLESSVVLIPALIPWSTSCVGIVAFTGMPTSSVLCAFLPLLVPLWILALSLWQMSHPSFVDGRLAHALGLTEADDFRRLAA